MSESDPKSAGNDFVTSEGAQHGTGATNLLKDMDLHGTIKDPASATCQDMASDIRGSKSSEHECEDDKEKLRREMYE